MKLTESIYQVCGGMYSSHQNVYAIDAGDEIVLIDSGKNKNDLNIIRKNLSYWGLEQKPVKSVLLTHAHVEHSGNSAELERSGAVIYAHPLCKEAVETGNDRTALYAFPDCGGYFDKCLNVSTVKEGEQITCGNVTFSVLEIPGHTDDSVIYTATIDNRQVMFSGDVLYGQRLNSLSMIGWTGSPDFNTDKLMESLKRLSYMYADIILPGHGDICLREGFRMLPGAYLRARLQIVTQPKLDLGTDDLFR